MITKDFSGSENHQAMKCVRSGAIFDEAILRQIGILQLDSLSSSTSSTMRLQMTAFEIMLFDFPFYSGFLATFPR
jgi:hypothetical protein